MRKQKSTPSVIVDARVRYNVLEFNSNKRQVLRTDTESSKEEFSRTFQNHLESFDDGRDTRGNLIQPVKTSE